MVAPLITVAWVKTKSSAVSVSEPEPAGLESAPSAPSGLPVVNENGLGSKSVVTGKPDVPACACALRTGREVKSDSRTKATPAVKIKVFCIVEYSFWVNLFISEAENSESGFGSHNLAVNVE